MGGDGTTIVRRLGCPMSARAMTVLRHRPRLDHRLEVDGEAMRFTAGDVVRWTLPWTQISSARILEVRTPLRLTPFLRLDIAPPIPLDASLRSWRGRWWFDLGAGDTSALLQRDLQPHLGPRLEHAGWELVTVSDWAEGGGRALRALRWRGAGGGRRRG